MASSGRSRNIVKTAEPSSHRKCSLHDWSDRLGHPSAESFAKMAIDCQGIPKFCAQDLRDLQCIACMRAKLHRAPIKPFTFKTSTPSEHVSMEFSGPVKPSSDRDTYMVSILDSFSTKSDGSLVKAKTDLTGLVRDYKRRMENQLRARAPNPNPLAVRVRRAPAPAGARPRLGARPRAAARSSPGRLRTTRHPTVPATGRRARQPLMYFPLPPHRSRGLLPACRSTSCANCKPRFAPPRR